MNQSYQISHSSKSINTAINLPSSKSESNRALIINACTGNKCKLINLSEARDTRTMQRLLRSDTELIDVLDAGTTMRFLTAYYAVTGQQKTITGTERMQLRPIGILVDALRQLGADIKYLSNDGFPPLSIGKFNYNGDNLISMRGDVSSQFISAILLVAPLLPEGIKISLSGNIGSKPYIDMTLALMHNFGVKGEWHGNSIIINPQPYQPAGFWVESDWSAASYWYSIAALAENASIKLNGLKAKSLQGDSIMAEIGEKLGIKAEFATNTVTLTKSESVAEFNYDFTNCPDLAQTVAVICAAKNIKLQMTGLESLRIKETDRTAALQTELSKLGHTLTQRGNTWTLDPNTHQAQENIVVDTYDDHRMAMAFAPMALIRPIIIDNPVVVDKSYPHFWKDLAQAGFEINAAVL